MSLLYDCCGIEQRYGERVTLRMPELRIERGETLILTGPNGAGKSTLLRLLAFLEEPAAGVLRFHGTAGIPPRREATLLLQEPWLLNASVFDNVVYGLRLRGAHYGMQRHTRHDLREAALEALAITGFAPDAARNLLPRRRHELSGGERQRVALAARLILRPLALLLDEPTSNVDAAAAKAVEAAVRNAAQAGTTVVAASHDTDLLRGLNARTLALCPPQD